MSRRTVTLFARAKAEGRPITMLTAYDATMAALVDRAGIDTILVGDSLGMVMLGHDSTVPVTMDDMVRHTAAVVRGSQQALVVADMPFLSHHIDTATTVRNAGRLVQEGGAGAVKLEGGRDIADQVRAIVRAQIPVVGHLGLTPQSVHALGGYRVQGKDTASARGLLDDALALQDAGASAVVLECVPTELAQVVSRRLDIATIGIGAGAGCDGQVLVSADMLGMYDRMAPRFVKHFAEVGTMITDAVRGYADEVRQRTFPDADHSFAASAELLAALDDLD